MRNTTPTHTLKNKIAIIRAGANVMNLNLIDFCRISAISAIFVDMQREKLAFFLNTNAMIQFLHKLAVLRVVENKKSKNISKSKHRLQRAIFKRIFEPRRKTRAQA
jgi:hypothetical protein